MRVTDLESAREAIDKRKQTAFVKMVAKKQATRPSAKRTGFAERLEVIAEKVGRELDETKAPPPCQKKRKAPERTAEEEEPKAAEYNKAAGKRKGLGDWAEIVIASEIGKRLDEIGSARLG